MGYGLIEPLRLDKKVLICSKLFNMNALLGKVEEQDPIPRGITPGKNYNAHLLSAIQPQGGISFTDERIVRKGDGHEACIHIYKYPSKVSISWLSKIIM